MALHERVFGIETEYAINFYPTATNGKQPNKQKIVETLHRVLVQQYGVETGSITPCYFLVTGAKFHHDVGHAEWAHAECRSARELAAYDKAADHLLAQILPQAQNELRKDGYEGQILIAKNNADFEGNTYGCHENYLMLRNNEFLRGDLFHRYVARCMIPFLISRQLFAGAGRLVSTAHQLNYEISQRAAFIDTIVSRDTTKERPIFNTGREYEPLAGENYRRLHLIVGDANLSGWATWMKLGTTGIILRMLEDLFIVDTPLLHDPLAALRTIARDTTCRRVLPMRDGRHMSALDIQSFYYERADAYLAEFGCSDEEDALMDEWEKTLNDLESDPMKLRNRVDWVIKKHFLNAYLNQAGISWESGIRDPEAIRSLQAYDLRFHDISRNGLFNQFFFPDTMITAAEIEKAQQTPPPYTRARIRGEAISQARQHNLPITVNTWMDFSLNGEVFDISDPLEFDHPQLPTHSMALLHQLEKACRAHPQDASKHFQLGLTYQKKGFYNKAKVAFQQAVKLQPQEPVYIKNLSATCLHCGDYQEAIDLSKRINRLTEEKKELYFNDIGEVYRYLGRYDEAIKAYQQQIQIAPETLAGTFALENLGQVFLKLGQIDAAEEQFQLAMHREKDELLISPLVLGVLQLWRGNISQACELLQSVLSLSEATITTITPDSQSYFRAIAHIALGNEQGPSLLKEALKRRDPPAAEGLFLLIPLIRLILQAAQPLEYRQALLDLMRETEDARISESQSEQSLENQIFQHDLAWLRSIATHRDEYIRKRAAKYLGWRKTNEVIALLKEMLLHDESVPVRLAAIKALGEITNPVAQDLLMTCLGDATPQVRWAAEETLEEKNRDIPPPTVPIKPPNSDDREQLIQIL